MRYSVFSYGMCCAVLLSMGELIGGSANMALAVPDAKPKSQSEEIISLARTGKNVEAIALYEAHTDKSELSMVVMRAVAGCYWRERQFEKSRDLYQQILDRRPTLRKLSKTPEAVSPLLAKKDDSVSETEQKVDVEGTGADQKDNHAKLEHEFAEVREAKGQQSEELEAELAKLREANSSLEEQRESLRKRTAERIAALAATAEASTADMAALRDELDEERKKREVAEGVKAQILGSLENQEQSLIGKIAELETALEATRTELDETVTTSQAELEELEKARKTEAEELAQALAKEHQRREASENMAKEIQQSLEERESDLSDHVTALDSELRLARAALEQSELAAGERVEATEVRATALAERVDLLESQANAARAEVVELAHALEATRLQNAEMSARQAVVAERAAEAIDAAEQTALGSALKEIDALEQEYAMLDASARRRQKSLLARIDALEQASVTGESDLAEARRQLEIERALRKAMEAQGEKRDGSLLEANRVLASAAEKMALQFDAIRAQMRGESELKLRDHAEKPADLAPLIGRLEEATESATVEVKELQRLLAEEREQHAATKAQSEKDIAALKRTIEVLTQELDAERAASAKLELQLRAEMAQKLTELRSAGEAREAELLASAAEREAALQKKIDETEAAVRAEAEQRQVELKAAHEAAVASLGEEIKAAVTELQNVKQQLAGQQKAYETLVVDTGDVELLLRERIRDLEQAFALPTSVDAAATRADGAGDTELDDQVDALYQSIIDTASKDKALAIAQFESLPEESVKPPILLKTIANLYRAKRNYAKAYDLYEEMLARAPGDLYAERKLVMTLFDMGRYDEALERLAGPQGAGTSTDK